MQTYEQGINHEGYLQTNRRLDLTNAALLAEELVEIYSTPTPKVWLKQKSKGTCLFD